ncbi:MAG: alpha/beta hydrolase [Magnetospirillum sp. WYHS-4]
MAKWRARLNSRALCLSFFCLLAAGGCREYFDPTGVVLDQVKASGWKESPIDVGPFVLTSFQKASSSPARELRVYIEGDGNAFSPRGLPTGDPTPLRPIALDLALADSSPAVAYLGRPCQYTMERWGKGCDVRMWTSHRFSEEAIAGTDRAIGHLKKKSGADQVVLIGFSGGGALAALVAARRDDVAVLATVAGTLDHEIWTRHHGVQPMQGSKNPAGAATRIKGLPQVHFVGADDRIMPRLVADSYMRSLGADHAARLVVVPDQEHECCWAKVWPALLRQLPSPRPQS